MTSLPKLSDLPSNASPLACHAMRSSSKLRSLAAVLTACLLVAGCQTASLSDVTGSIGPSSDQALPTSQAELHSYAEQWSRRYDSNPDSKIAAMNYAKALRALTQYAQAVAVLQKLATRMPKDMEVLSAYGKALADDGRLQEAADVLGRSHTPERPNWSVLSAQGSVADQLGDHDQAQSYYEAALKIAPDQPQVLSNLGLSYALSKHLPKAETTLQQAAAQPSADMRVRQNLALVLALQGKFNEAETIARRDLSPVDAATNVASIRQMISQSNTWAQIQKYDSNPKASSKAQASANLN